MEGSLVDREPRRFAKMMGLEVRRDFSGLVKAIAEMKRQASKER